MLSRAMNKLVNSVKTFPPIIYISNIRMYPVFWNLDIYTVIAY